MRKVCLTSTNEYGKYFMAKFYPFICSTKHSADVSIQGTSAVLFANTACLRCRGTCMQLPNCIEYFSLEAEVCVCRIHIVKLIFVL